MSTPDIPFINLETKIAELERELSAARELATPISRRGGFAEMLREICKLAGNYADRVMLSAVAQSENHSEQTYESAIRVTKASIAEHDALKALRAAIAAAMKQP